MLTEFLIDGEASPAAAGATFTRHDPVTGEVASTAAAASATDALRAVDAANAAFPAWSKTPPFERRKLLNKVADIMDARTGDFIAAAMAETGATGPWIGFNVMLAANMIREAAAMVTQMGGEIIPSNKPGSLSMAVMKPKGVCLGIAPWNAPVILGTRAIAMPVACGNTVVLKSSEMCPATHRLIGQCFAEAGFAAGIVNVVSNAPDDAAGVVEALIRAPAVRHVNFTGSTRVGRIIGKLAGENLKPALLELGGKAPLLVLDDADIDGAVNAAIFGCYMNMGQICMSTERIIVDVRIADEFAAKFAARARTLPAGNPRGQVVLGGLCMPGAGARMDALIADAVALGGKVLAGGSRDGAIVTATVIDHVTPAMRVYSEESFGPVKPIIRVEGEAEAIRVANDSEYGLSSAVFSRNIQRAMDVANRIESGICHINGPTVADEPQMPFGGVKASGHGQVRRSRGDRRVHRSALDHDRGSEPALSVLIEAIRNMPCLIRPWGHMHYASSGPDTAPAVLWMNSLGLDLRMWDDVIARVPGWRHIRFDKRGHGLSATPADPWDVTDLAGDAVALLDHLHVTRSVIAGCSVGGMVAQALGIAHPARTRAMILSNTGPKIGTVESWNARIAAVQAGGMAAIAGAVMERWFAPVFRASDSAKLWETMLLRCDPDGYAGTCGALANADFRADIGRIAVPALLIAGGQDLATPPVLVAEAAAMMRRATLVTLPASGHIPAIDAPEAAAGAIVAFLEGLSDD